MICKVLGLIGIVAATGCMVISADLDQGVKGSGKEATEHRTVTAFSKIDMRGAYDVQVNVGPATGVTITGDDNLLKLVETTVKDATLVLSTKKNVHPSKNGLKVSITTPDLSSFSLSGAGDVNID